MIGNVRTAEVFSITSQLLKINILNALPIQSVELMNNDLDD